MDKTLLILLGLLAAVGAAVFILLPGAPATPATSGAAVVRTSAALPSVDGVIKPGEYSGKTVVGDVEVNWATEKNALRVGLVSPGTVGWRSVSTRSR